MVKISPRKDVPFKALFTYHMFKKTGVMPVGECFDAEYFQKAADEVNSDEMDEACSAQNCEKDAQDAHDIVSMSDNEEDLDEKDPALLNWLHQLLIQHISTNADKEAHDIYQKKESKPIERVMPGEIQHTIPAIQNSIQEKGSDNETIVPIVHTEGQGARESAMDELIANKNSKDMDNFLYSNDLYKILYTAVQNLFTKRMDISGDDLSPLVNEFMDSLTSKWINLYRKQ